MEPKDAVQWAGAATEARAKNTAAEIAITATTLLGVSAATKVNTAIATRPTMIGSLRELIGENPPCRPAMGPVLRDRIAVAPADCTQGVSAKANFGLWV